MAARKRNYQTEKTKEKIRDTINTKNIIEKFQAHLNGDIEMKGTQVKVGEALLARVLPVMSQNENIDVTDEPDYEEMVAHARETLTPDEFKVFCKMSGIVLTTHDEPDTIQ